MKRGDDRTLATRSGSGRYRADIDGLRAFAVLAVILCHAGVGGFNGGFVGVDVFFVISGFLIHRDLTARLATGRSSILAFYGRRMRRTLPALYLVAASTLAVSAFVLLPDDLEAEAHALLGVLALVPNLVLLAQTGYFDADAVSKPLLHSWSLGVEEQFYLVAPLLALALLPLARPSRRAVLLVAFAVAFGLTLLMETLAPSAAFYLMPARAFEFLIGAMLAEEVLPPVRAGWLAEALAATAMLALAASVATFVTTLPHPGWPTLVPCLATAALIYVGTDRRTLVGAALSAKAPRLVGLVSYSLYLWHWPILVLARYADCPTSLPWRLGELLLLAVLAAATWAWVEQPFRDPSSAWRRRAPVLLPGAAAVLAACCGLVVALDGLPDRFPAEIAAVASFIDYRDTKPFREGRCFITSQDEAADFDGNACLSMAANEPNVLLMGDSHAADLWTGLRDTWPGVHFLQATASGCLPLADTSGPARCTGLMRDMFDRFIPEHSLDAIVLSALWSEADVVPLERTLAALSRRGVPVIVFGPVPRYDVPLATLLARSMLHGDPEDAARHRRPDTAALDARLRAAVSPYATYVSSWDALCPNGRCQLFASEDVPLQFDYHHLTAQGADVLMRRVVARHFELFKRQRSAGHIDVSGP